MSASQFINSLGSLELALGINKEDFLKEIVKNFNDLVKKIQITNEKLDIITDLYAKNLEKNTTLNEVRIFKNINPKEKLEVTDNKINKISDLKSSDEVYDKKMEDFKASLKDLLDVNTLKGLIDPEIVGNVLGKFKAFSDSYASHSGLADSNEFRFDVPRTGGANSKRQPNEIKARFGYDLTDDETNILSSGLISLDPATIMATVPVFGLAATGGNILPMIPQIENALNKLTRNLYDDFKKLIIKKLTSLLKDGGSKLSEDKADGVKKIDTTTDRTSDTDDEIPSPDKIIGLFNHVSELSKPFASISNGKLSKNDIKNILNVVKPIIDQEVIFMLKRVLFGILNGNPRKVGFILQMGYDQIKPILAEFSPFIRDITSIDIEQFINDILDYCSHVVTFSNWGMIEIPGQNNRVDKLNKDVSRLLSFIILLIFDDKFFDILEKLQENLKGGRRRKTRKYIYTRARKSRRALRNRHKRSSIRRK
jgi:hypothetical protein